jgi:hypothetical protein
MKKNKKIDKLFIENFWSYYKPDGMYGDDFDNKLKKIEVVIAAIIMKEFCRENKLLYCGDTDDRLNTAELITHLFNYPYTPMKYEDAPWFFEDVVRQRMIKNIIISFSNKGFEEQEKEAEYYKGNHSEK